MLFSLLFLMGLSAWSVTGESCSFQNPLEKLLGGQRKSAPLSERKKALEALETYLKQEAEIKHSIIRRGNLVTLKIGFLKREESRFARLVQVAVSKGAFNAIDAGSVVGPKVLHLLKRLKDIVPADRPLLIKGSLNTEVVMIGRNNAVVTTNNSMKTAKLSWSQQEIEHFDESLEFFKVSEACRRIYQKDLSECGPLSFTFDASEPESIQWSRYDDSFEGRLRPDVPDDP